MPAAARVGDSSTHGGVITGPGVATVLVGGKPAAVAGDVHICSLPPNAHAPTASPFVMGSTTVTITGKSVVRVSDPCSCGAMAAVGEPSVLVGG